MFDDDEFEKMIQKNIIEPNQKKIDEWWQFNIDMTKKESIKNKKLQYHIKEVMADMDLDEDQAITLMLAAKILHEK